MWFLEDMFRGAFQEMGESGEGNRCCYEVWRNVTVGTGQAGKRERRDEKEVEKRPRR